MATMTGDRSGNSPDGPARDVIRRERFGGLYFKHREHTYLRLEPDLCELLTHSTRNGCSTVRSYGAIQDRLKIDRAQLAETLWSFQEGGLVDEELRCHARVVDHHTDHDGLSAPMYLHLQLTRACNQSCRHCFVATTPGRDPDELTTGECLDLIRQLADLGCMNVAVSGGEPLLRSDCIEILRGFEARGLDALLYTNGTLIDEGTAAALAGLNLRVVSVSLDGPDARTHDEIRGTGSFDRAVAGVRKLARAGAPRTQLRVTVTAFNAARLDGLAALAAELGVHRVSLQPFRLGGQATAGGRTLYLDRARYARTVGALTDAWPGTGPTLHHLAFERTDLDPYLPVFGCPGAHTTATVTADGTVQACGFFDDGAWNLRERTLQDCWLDAPGMQTWRSLRASDRCRSCVELARCHGGCRARAVGLGGDFCDPDPWGPCADDEGEDPRTVF